MKTNLNLELTAALDAAWRARQAIASQVGESLPGPRLSQLLATVSELVTNSVKHGPGEPIHVSVRVSNDGTIFGRVEDGGRGRVAIREGVDPIEGGMGLKLVEAFTDRWGVEDGTTNVWFEIAARRFGPAL
jgi:anti-sigma regulatory factor (Ser/Thr protein kinase)